MEARGRLQKLAVTRRDLGFEAVDLLLEIVDEAESRCVERPLVVGEGLDVPAHELPQNRLDRRPETAPRPWSQPERAVRGDRPETLHLRPGRPAFVLASRGGPRVRPGAANLLLQPPEELLDIDGNPCRFAIFAVVRRHRGILARG